MTRKITEEDTRARLIDPALRKAGWQPEQIWREHYFTHGRKLTGGKRGRGLKADYLLRHHNNNLAIIEAKKLGVHPTQGLQQAIDYAQKLQVDVVYATNGVKIYEYIISRGYGDYIDQFPSPEELYHTTYGNGLELKKKLHSIPFLMGGGYTPRYYQEIAVQRVMNAVADNKQRILLTLATGTGKTFIAFQVVHKLLTARWNLEQEERKPRILFLADRNVLVDQAMTNTFNPYENDLIKINGAEIKARNGVVPTNAYIFFAIYQAIADRDNGTGTEEENLGGYYRKYPKDFFDLIIIDECHRGSANENGSWREILDYFSTAVHLGLTATPKRDDNVDTYNYFGPPIYEYSLKEGINDGFLTPFKIKRLTTSIDKYIRDHNDLVVEGQLVKDLYDINDFNKSIILPQRTELVARTILEQIRPLDKTIIFCANQRHALDVRDAINKHKTVNDPEYCVRITSDEGELGKTLLKQFQDNTRDIPTLLTSSKMLTTGVDAKNVRNIVLTAPIGSMVEFKQIVGRGTRLYENKDYFTVMDFVEATDHFYDPEWDGPQEGETTTIVPGVPTPAGPKIPDDDLEEPPEGYPVETAVVLLADGRNIKVTNEDTRYVDASGKPLTVREFIEKLVGEVPQLFESEQQLRTAWAHPDTREALLVELGEQGFDREQLDQLRNMVASPQTDLFDVLAHLCYRGDLKTRQQRVGAAASDPSFTVYKDARAKNFLQFVLQHYEAYGMTELRRDKLPDLVRLNLGTTHDAKRAFGGTQQLIDAYLELQKAIYRVS
ncbi:MAG: DEAD/DEAH box helicase family protein [Nonlabens sp.]